MLLAAYMVTGFLVASVYAVGMLRGRRDRYHRLGFMIPFTVAAIATPIQFFVGDTAARAIADDQPAKFAAMECIYKGGPDQTEYLGGRLRRRPGQGRDRDPRARLVPGRASARTRTSPASIRSPRTTSRPPRRCCTWPSTRWSGIGTPALPARRLVRVRLVAASATCPQTKWFLRAVALAGVAAVVALECGWIVTEVGRQPWIVNGYMRTAEAVTPAQGIWWVFGADVALYAALGVIAVAGPARPLAPLARGRARGRASSRTARRPRRRDRRRRHEQRRRLRGDPLGRGHALRDLRRRRLRRRLLGPARRRRASARSGSGRRSIARSARSGRPTTSG